VRLGRLLAWLAWAAVYLEFLGQSSLRINVFVQLLWMYVTGQRGSRLIVNHHPPSNGDSRAAGAETAPSIFFTSRRENFASARSALNGINGFPLAATLLCPEVEAARPH
jgi:hypothetical protein